MRLPPGFRFHPTDVELILYYLKRKTMGKKLHYEAIAEVNIYKFSPWDLPDKSSLKSKDLEWFFFCPREKKYATGVRVKRATENGYWKTTGKDRIISCNDKTVGAVKTLIFHLGHAPQGERTDWVIHEYRIHDDQLAEAGVQDNYVLCKVFKKNGLGPKNGAQYGAPFNEDEWADDDDDDDNDVAQNHAISLAAEDQPQTVSMQPEEQSLLLGSGLFDFGSVNGQLPIHEGLSSSVVAPARMMAAGETNDEIVQLLNSFADEDMLCPDGNGLKQDDLTDNGKYNVSSNEGLEIYNGLHDLDSWTKINEGGFDFSGVQFGNPSNMLPEDNSTYIELDDLRLPLDCSTEVTTGAHFSSLCEASASYDHENMQQLSSGTRLACMDQYTMFANELAMLPNTSEGDRSLDVLQMMDHHFYQGAIASYNIDPLFEQLENGVYPPHTMERGSHLVNLYSRFTESIPAYLSSAAKLLVLSTYGGSSIHIKAEVTHGAGECTNEALEVMMGGSSSCWCNLLLRKFQLRVLEGLLNLVEFISNLILVRCINDTVPWTYYYCLDENLPYSFEQPKLIISLILFDCYKLSHIDKK